MAYVDHTPHDSRTSYNLVWDAVGLEWVKETQPGGGGGGGGAMTVANGADVAEGATTDAAVVTDTTGTISGKLRGLVKWAFERMPTSLGQKTKAASLPVVIASDQILLPNSSADGTLTNDGDTVELAVSGLGGVSVSLDEAAFSSGAVAFELSRDGSNWYPWYVVEAATGLIWLTSESFGLGYSRVSGNTHGLQKVRARATSGFAGPVPLHLEGTFTPGPTHYSQIVQGAVDTSGSTALAYIYNPSTNGPYPRATHGANGTDLPVHAGAGEFDDASPTTITENQFGNLRISANRNLYGTIRDAAGNERGANVTAGNALVVDGSASTQPISGTITANAGTNLNTSALALETTQAAGNVLTGAVTEAAPASDTASSGLNGRLQRIAQRLTSLITALGSPFQAGGSIGNTSFIATQATAANLNMTEASAATRLSESDFDTKIGSLTETAPASDTASSGLNGRLQRIAQRLTSLITALGSPFQAGGSIGNAFGLESTQLLQATATGQTTGNASLSSLDGKIATLGQKTMAGSTPVVLASDQSAIPVTSTITGTVVAPTIADVQNNGVAYIDGALAKNVTQTSDGRLRVNSVDADMRRLAEQNLLELREQDYRLIAINELYSGNRAGFELR